MLLQHINSAARCVANSPATKLIYMARRRPLTDVELADVKRLQREWNRRRHALGLTQEEVATLCGWSTQGAFSQYLRGRIPLNLRAAIQIARVLQVDVAEISPQLAEQLPSPQQHLAEEVGRHGSPPPGADNNPKRLAWMRLYDQIERVGLTDTVFRLLRNLANQSRAPARRQTAENAAPAGKK
jgi:transcriptional regulator with XRE-family HTH domain